MNFPTDQYSLTLIFQSGRILNDIIQIGRGSSSWSMNVLHKFHGKCYIVTFSNSSTTAMVRGPQKNLILYNISPLGTMNINAN